LAFKRALSELRDYVDKHSLEITLVAFTGELYEAFKSMLKEEQC